MKDYGSLLARIAADKRFPNEQAQRLGNWSLTHLEKEDVLCLLDRRTGERRELEWKGFRNYLYGWSCPILAELVQPECAVMLIDAARDMAFRLRREFWLLTMPPANVEQAVIADEIRSNPERLARTKAHLERLCHPDQHHNIWGRVAVENGKPIGLYVDGEIVRQTVDKHWSEID